MKLYYSPAACSLAVHILLRECEQSFELIKVDTGRKLTARGDDFYAVNPKGQVPVLELDDGSRLTEGPVIAQYLADRAHATHIMPAAGTLARYRVMEWQNYISTELHKSFTPLFHAELDAKAKATLLAGVRNKLVWLDSELGARPYLSGEQFSAADAYLFVVLGWARFVSLELGAFPHLQAFVARVAQRRSVQEAMRTEGLPGSAG